MKTLFVLALLFSSSTWAIQQKGTCIDTVERAENNSSFSRIFNQNFDGLWAYERTLVCRNMNNKLKETFECMGQIKKALKNDHPFKNASGEEYDAPYAILCSGVEDWERALECVKEVRRNYSGISAEGVATICSMGNSGEQANRCIQGSLLTVKPPRYQKLVELCAGVAQPLNQRKFCMQTSNITCGKDMINVSALPEITKAITCSQGPSAVCCAQDLWTNSREQFSRGGGPHSAEFNVGYACGRGETAAQVKSCLPQVPLEKILDKGESLTSGTVRERNRLSNIAFNGVIQVCGGFPYTDAPAGGAAAPASR